MTKIARHGESTHIRIRLVRRDLREGAHQMLNRRLEQSAKPRYAFAGASRTLRLAVMALLLGRKSGSQPQHRKPTRRSHRAAHRSGRFGRRPLMDCFTSANCLHFCSLCSRTLPNYQVRKSTNFRCSLKPEEACWITSWICPGAPFPR